MKIQFEIKEKMPEIIEEILHSEEWVTNVTHDNHNLKRVVMKETSFGLKTSVDIWENEIHIMVDGKNQTYRIFQKDNTVLCEYIGEHRGLLGQMLLPKITPLKKLNYLNQELEKGNSSKKESADKMNEGKKEIMPIPVIYY